jgi:hypothetical protein
VNRFTWLCLVWYNELATSGNEKLLRERQMSDDFLQQQLALYERQGGEEAWKASHAQAMFLR